MFVDRVKIHVKGGDGGDDQIAADLSRVLHLDIESRFDARADDHRRFAGQLTHGSLAGIENRRYDRRDNDALDALRINLIKIQKIFEFHAVLVGGLEQVGRHADLDENAVVLHTAEHDVGIADIDR